MARTGPCSPWINGTDVANMPSVALAISRIPKLTTFNLTDDQVNVICAEGAAAATELLFVRSGRIYTGSCGPVTIRPVSRPRDVDIRSWLGGGGAWGYSGSWGSASYYGLSVGGVVSHFGYSQNPPVITFSDYPVNSIDLVLIDGVVIPPNEYELRANRELVRIRPTASSTPTERWGWPTSQIGDLPDTEQGTFSVTYHYGQDPGEMGRLACRKMAEILVLPQFGDTDRFSSRVTSISRQGVSAAVADVMDILSKGDMGVYEVDSWLATVNPTKTTRQSLVWSPDMGRKRRTAKPSPRR